jgi:hypothetical protein
VGRALLEGSCLSSAGGAIFLNDGYIYFQRNMGER